MEILEALIQSMAVYVSLAHMFLNYYPKLRAKQTRSPIRIIIAFEDFSVLWRSINCMASYYTNASSTQASKAAMSAAEKKPTTQPLDLALPFGFVFLYQNLRLKCNLLQVLYIRIIMK